MPETPIGRHPVWEHHKLFEAPKLSRSCLAPTRSEIPAKVEPAEQHRHAQAWPVPSTAATGTATPTSWLGSRLPAC